MCPPIKLPTNLSFSVVGACIARPLIGNGFFLKQIGMIEQLGVCGRPVVAPTLNNKRFNPFKAAPACGGGGTPPKRRDGGGRRFRYRQHFNYNQTFNYTVGADPCVRPGNVNRVYQTIRFYRDKRTYNSPHKNQFEIICCVPVLRADPCVRPLNYPPTFPLQL